MSENANVYYSLVQSVVRKVVTLPGVLLYVEEQRRVVARERVALRTHRVVVAGVRQICGG